MGNNQTIEASIARVIERTVVKHTIPLFHESEKKPPKKIKLPNGASLLSIVGSGVFVTYKGNYMILTARHVIEGESKVLFVPHPNENMNLIQLTARYAFNAVSSSPTKDIGFILLTKEIGELVSYRYDPIDFEAIGQSPGRQIANYIELFAEHYQYVDYCVCGYPTAATKPKNNSHQTLVFDIRFGNEWKKNSIYLKHGIDPDEHTIIQVGLYLAVNGKRSVKHEIPPMNGMSGCGVWSYYPYYDKNNQLQLFYKLAGIFHTYNKVRHEFLQFTKYSVIENDIKTKVYPLGQSISISINDGPSKSFWG